ncbi:hypothetical protein ACFZDI_06695 [Streptomyces sp. NPDC007907]|uniref:hypothetical protein n=1 Tax=Streptomyces sp. NPDC007907 TaxID=3364789 RepID=UPI0036E3E8C1
MVAISREVELPAVYGDLYLSERSDGQPFDVHDENVVMALATAGRPCRGAGVSRDEQG